MLNLFSIAVNHVGYLPTVRLDIASTRTIKCVIMSMTANKQNTVIMVQYKIVKLHYNCLIIDLELSKKLDLILMKPLPWIEL